MDRELTQDVYDFLFNAAQVIVESGEEQRPILFAFSVGDETNVIAMQIETEDSPAPHAAMLSSFLLREGVASLTCFVCEAYLVASNKEAKAKAIERGSLKHDPDATEALFFAFSTLGERALAACPITVEDGARKMTKVEVVYESESNVLGGRTYPPKRTVH